MRGLFRGYVPAVAAASITLQQRVVDVRVALGTWAQAPARVVLPWIAMSLLLGATLLGGALLVAGATTATPQDYIPVFADDASGLGDAVRIFGNNALVLALQTLVCLATYLATRLDDDRRQQAAGQLALSVIAGLTLFSFTSQTWRLGHDLASAAHTLGLSDAALLARACVHAVPELTAAFLPLGACLVLVRRRRFDDLAAAGLLSAALALPVVAVCACIEVWITPLVV